MTPQELARLRALRDRRRGAEQEAEYRILMHLAGREVESSELRLIELRALASGGTLPVMSVPVAADEETVYAVVLDDELNKDFGADS